MSCTIHQRPTCRQVNDDGYVRIILTRCRKAKVQIHSIKVFVKRLSFGVWNIH
jgi:hypothetical protein